MSIVVQSGFVRSHSQTSHIKYEDTLHFSSSSSFEEVFQKTNTEMAAGFNSRGLGRHLGLRQNALSMNRLATNRAKFSSKCMCSVHTVCVRSAHAS